MLWIVALSLLASTLICPSSVAWRIGEGAIAAYHIFHLALMTGFSIALCSSRKQKDL
jgi:hypothetical protein